MMSTDTAHTTRPPIAWERIATALPANQADTLMQLARTASTYGATLYLVGGAARSVFDGQAITDLDIAISHISPAIVTALAQAVGGRVAQHDQFATATLVMPDDATIPNIDVVPTRQETYAHPGALPGVAPADIITDLARRDISVNAIAIAVVPGGHCPVYDPFDGIGDLRRRVARLLHPTSCVDDPTRIIRMARIATRLGLRVTRPSLQAVQQAHTTGALAHVSQHRWMQELRKTMAEPDPGRVLARLQQWGVLTAIHPALRYARRLHAILPTVPQAMRLAVMLWQARHTDLVTFVATWHEAPTRYRQLPELRRTIATYRRRRPITPSQIAALLRPYDAGLCASIAMVDTTLADMLTIWHHAQQHTPPLLISGADLVAAGISPGVQIGQRLAALRDALLDGQCTAHTHATQQAWALTSLTLFTIS